MPDPEPDQPPHPPAPVHGIRPPQPPDFGAVPCVAENWKIFKQKWTNYSVITNLGTHSREYQVALLLHTIGDDGLRIYNGFKFDTEENVRSVAEILTMFDTFAIGEVNETYERFLFNKRDQDSGEPFEAFLSAIRTLIKTCNYHKESVNSILRDRIVLGIRERDTQKLLLRERNLTLESCVNICKAAENADIQGKVMRDDAPSVKRVQGKPKKQAQAASAKVYPSKKSHAESTVRECNFCGQKHVMKKSECPAFGKTCTNCKGTNHFKIKCKKPKNKVHAVADDSHESDDEDSWLYSVTHRKRTILTAKMVINKTNINFQLDSGADVNTICRRFVQKNQVRPTSKRLVMWNETKVIPIGEATLPVTNLKTGECIDVTFVVVPNNLVCLLGLTTIRDMNLITIHEDRFVAHVEKQTVPLGDLGEVELRVDPEVKPRALPSRKIPVALKDDVKAEIDNLVDRGVLIPVTEPTEWVSQMAVVRKGNGKLRICIDPQPLNAALMREHYKLPTVDDVLPMLHDAKVFSKVDVKEAFWHVRLDEHSSKLTTMITPFGRFRWARLPFGLKVSSEIFQRKLTEALSGLDGTFTIADDIIVAGCGSTIAEATKDNDEKLIALDKRCEQRHIVLNNDKKEISKSQISFHGHLFTNKGVKVDEAKVEAVLKMPTPTDVHGVKRLCGMVQYMAKFLPNLADDMEPIRSLTRKEAEWNWSSDCDQALETVKKKLTETPVLAYFDAKKDVVIQVDSSKDGLGAVLLQGGQPVEYASRTLSSSERNWAQIEKELLAVTFGLERFDQYTYGIKVVVENDHKPLASILKKPLSQAPKRLQALLMRVHRYDVDFHFKKGTELLVADTLSRAYIDKPDVRPRVMNIKWFPDFPDARLIEIREATEKDQSLQTVKSLILDGWPEHKDKVPSEAKVYFDLRDMLSHENGILLKGEAILIPSSLRKDLLKRLHSAHLGYNSMLRRARGLVFWPNMARDVKQLVDTCEPCQELRPRNQKETLLSQEDGDYPWDKVASDIFEIAGKEYLVTIDCFSNFIEVDHLTTSTSARVISVFKKLFARVGIPRVLITDSGSQYVSREFLAFAKEWGIIQVQSSPGHHSANGKAEAAVKVAKYLMIKAVKDGTDPNIALLEQRNTPRQDTGLSPAEMVFGRKTRTMIPCFQPRKGDGNSAKMKDNGRIQRKQAVKRHHDKRARDLPKLIPKQNVYFEHREHDRWMLGKVLEVIGDRTYIVEGQNGGVYRRNRIQMRPTAVEMCKPPVIVPHSAMEAVQLRSDSTTMDTTPRSQLDVATDMRPTDSKTVANGDAGPPAGPPAPVRRSTRIRHEPGYMKDYVKKIRV